MNIFLSFSGEARESYAIKFLNFFNKYGIHCWYDQHELLLGDPLDETITTNGIEKVDYCIIIINKTFLTRKWPCEEAKRLYERFEKKRDCVIFPLLLDIEKQDLKNSKVDFLLNIKYQFLVSNQSIDTIGFQILNRIFSDVLQQYTYKTIEQILPLYKRLLLSDSINIYNSLLSISNFEETNYRDRTIFLICLIKLLNSNKFEKIIQEIGYFIYNNEPISFDIYKIAESIFLICSAMHFSIQ